MKEIFVVRHSGPFVKLYDYDNKPFEERSKNMILSVAAEDKAKKLCELKELNDIDEIYSSNSARAIGTAKYIAEKNNLEIKVDNRINERKFGITYAEELPDNFIEKQFNDETYKLENGESIFETKARFNQLLNELLENDSKKIVLSIHGVILMAYLSDIADVKFSNDSFFVKYKDTVILNGLMSNPDIYKITYNGKNVTNIERIIM